MPSAMYDVIIVGAGPAGITAANLLAAKGFNTLIIGQNVHQILQIPETFYGTSYEIFQKVGLENDFSKFIDEPNPIRLISVNDSFTYQITIQPNLGNIGRYGMSFNRAVFEELLINRTVERGATYLPTAVVEDFIFTSDRLTGVKCLTSTGCLEEYSAKVVIEASGQSSSLINRLGSSNEDTTQNKHIAVFAQYTSDGFSDIVPDNKILGITLDSGYVLAMPIANEKVSIMAALEGKKVSADGDNLEQIFQDAIKCWEPLAKFTQSAQKLTPTLLVKNQDWEYKRFSGKGFLVIGDAVAFLDPFSCNGIAIGMNAGEIAADFVTQSLKKSNELTDVNQLSMYDQQIRNLRDKWKRVWGIGNLSLSSMGLLKQSLGLLYQIQDIKLKEFSKEFSDVFKHNIPVLANCY